MMRSRGIRWFIILGMLMQVGGGTWAAAQDNSLESSATEFHLVLWHESGGLVSGVTSADALDGPLRDRWFEALLPALLNRNLRIHFPVDDSFERYVSLVQSLRPHALEGEACFVEHVFNSASEPEYLPILECQTDESETRYGEIIFRTNPPDWLGTLGVVHPWYELGGRAQIEYWQAHTGRIPNWVAYQSSREVLFHLFVGSIEAAAVPAQALETFLKERGRENLEEHVGRVRVPQAEGPIGIYLRQDWYENLLYRTLISETWLRDTFPQRFLAAPRYWPYFSHFSTPRFRENFPSH